MATTINIHEAKTHLSKLVDQAAKGHEFVIAKAGKPMVRVVPIEPLPSKRRLGFMAGAGSIGVDVKEAFAADVERMFTSAM